MSSFYLKVCNFQLCCFNMKFCGTTLDFMQVFLLAMKPVSQIIPSAIDSLPLTNYLPYIVHSSFSLQNTKMKKYYIYFILKINLIKIEFFLNLKNLFDVMRALFSQNVFHCSRISYQIGKAT